MDYKEWLKQVSEAANKTITHTEELFQMYMRGESPSVPLETCLIKAG